MLMRKPTSSTQLATFLFVDSQWHELHDAVQCRTHGLTFKFFFEFQTEFFSNFFFEFQVVRASNRLTIEGPLYTKCFIFCLSHKPRIGDLKYFLLTLITVCIHILGSEPHMMNFDVLLKSYLEGNCTLITTYNFKRYQSRNSCHHGTQLSPHKLN